MADVTQTFSFGVCTDHPELKVFASIDGSDFEVINLELDIPIMKMNFLRTRCW